MTIAMELIKENETRTAHCHYRVIHSVSFK